MSSTPQASGEAKACDRVRVRMLGVEVESVVHSTRVTRNKMEYRVAIPEGIENTPDFSIDERAYIRRSRDEGGFWYYASQLLPRTPQGGNNG